MSSRALLDLAELRVDMGVLLMCLPLDRVSIKRQRVYIKMDQFKRIYDVCTSDSDDHEMCKNYNVSAETEIMRQTDFRAVASVPIDVLYCY